MSDFQQQTFGLEIEHLVVLPVEPIPPVDPYRLPSYAPDAACPKCGHDVVSMKWHEVCSSGSACKVYIQAALSSRIPFPEHLDRTCSRCRYGWTEAIMRPSSNGD